MSKFKIESGAQLLARLVKKPDIPNFYPALFDSELKNGGVVEIISDIDTSNLLIDVITEALILGKSKENEVGVLLFNVAGKIDFRTLVNTINLKLKSKIKVDINTEKVELLYSILNNVFLLEIYDATQLHVTLHNLDNILAKHSNVSLIVFDSITALYWSEQGLKITPMDLYLKNLLQMIKKIARDYNVVIMYFKPEHFSSKKEYNVDIEKSEVFNGLNLKLQLHSSDPNVYQVGVKTGDSYSIRYFTVIENLIKWH